MSFIEKLENELNVSTTENGALGYKTTKSALVDFNFKVSSYRNRSPKTIIREFKEVWGENKELAYKYLFFARDIREGLGERRLFRTILPTIEKYLDENVFDLIMEFGRADDMFALKGTSLEDKMVKYIQNTLIQDTINSNECESVSLLAKWLPSPTTSSKETRELAKWLYKKMGLTEKEYRKILSGLRKYLDVTEKKMCAKQWGEIDYSKVSSQANLRYNNAFLRNDEERRRNYLSDLEKGKTKINSSTLFPHDIVYKYRSGSNYDIAFEEMWKALPDYVKGNSNTLAVRDGSGSMTWNGVGRSGAKPIDVATALSIYFSERAEGQFKNKFITFSSRPELVDLSRLNSLKDKIVKCSRYNDCSNTDIAKTFDLVLDVAVNNKLKQEEIPNLLIISDMEFNGAFCGNETKLFDGIAKKWKSYGYEMPRLIFWNICSRTDTIPLTQNKNGVVLISGFSPAIVNMVLSEKLNPYDALVEQLNKERYAKVVLKEEDK